MHARSSGLPLLPKSIALATVALAVASLCAARAAAQNEGFALNRFEAAEAGSDWFVGDSLDLRGEVRPAFRLAIDWAHNPLLRYDADGDVIAAVIEDQVHAHAGIALMLAERVRLGVNLPVLLAQGGEETVANGMTFGPSTGFAVGDLRLALDLRLFGEYGGPISMVLGGQLHAPTGDRDAFAGDGSVRLSPHLMIAGDLAVLAYSMRVGFTYRPADDGFGPVPTGSEVAFAVSAGIRAGGFLIGPELWGTTVVSGADSAFQRETTPFELLFGVHYKVSGFSIGAGAGPGLTQGLGAPEVRVVGMLAYAPDVSDRDGDGIYDNDDACPDIPGPENENPKLHGCPDRDGDTIIDPQDACPDEPGVRSSDPEKNGCPPEHDRDGDGIFDEVDACPDVPGVADSDPKKNGCPPDRDEDGIIDDEDACPDTPGVRSRDPKKNGCPPDLDRDGDGIVDEKDACPDVPGVANEDPALHGCPLARVEKDQIVITQRIEFEFNSAKLVSSSTPVLEAVLEILEEHAEISEVRIEGHTDNVGKAAYNKKLSDKRAASVVKWLVDHGIQAARLKSKGFGMENPIASNDDDVGRQKNRRVEFHIEERDESAETPEASSEEEAPAKEPPPSEPAKKQKAPPSDSSDSPAPKKDKSRELGDDLLDDPAMW